MDTEDNKIFYLDKEMGSDLLDVLIRLFQKI